MIRGPLWCALARQWCLGYSARLATSSKDRTLLILLLLGFIKVCKRVWGIDLAGLAVPVRAPRVS